MQNKIKELRKDLSQLEGSKDTDISNFRHWERLKEKKLEDWEEKVLHDQYLRQTKEARKDQC